MNTPVFLADAGEHGRVLRVRMINKSDMYAPIASSRIHKMRPRSELMIYQSNQFLVILF